MGLLLSGARLDAVFRWAGAIVAKRPVADGDEDPGLAAGGAGGEPGGLDYAKGGVERDGLILELADGEAWWCR
jgi:hypothetical protein